MELFDFLNRKGMSQIELARVLETTPSNVNRWAKNDGVPSYEMCLKLMRLGMTVNELFGIDPPGTAIQECSAVELIDIMQKSVNKALDKMKEELVSRQNKKTRWFYLAFYDKKRK